MQSCKLPEHWLGKPYFSLNAFLQQTFGEKIYRLSLDGGFTCPNRDGKLGVRGCTFCSAGGSGDFAADRHGTIAEQIAQAKQRIASKTTAKHFIAYFQAYTNTYADIPYLRTVFSEALSADEIVALSIATRVDCLEEDVLQLLCELRHAFSKPIWIELGVQSTCDETLRRVRSGFTYADCTDAIMRLHKYEIPSIVHLILGLPGEHKEQMLNSVKQICGLPVAGLKLQLLHILSGTDLAAEYQTAPFPLFDMEEYCQFLVTCIEHVPAHIVLHRITGDGPKRLLLAPVWSGDKKRVLNRIHAVFCERNTYQGRLLPLSNKTN